MSKKKSMCLATWQSGRYFPGLLQESHTVIDKNKMEKCDEEPNSDRILSRSNPVRFFVQ